MRLDQVVLVSISAVYKPVIVSIPLALDRICIHSNRRNQCMHIHHLHKVQLTMLHRIPVNIQTIRHRHNVHKRETRTKSLRSHIGMQLGKNDRTSSHRRSLTTRRKNWRQTSHEVNISLDTGHIFRPIYSYGMWLDQVTLVSISAVYKPVIVSIPLAHDRICIHSNRRNQCMHIHHLHKVQLIMLHHIPINIQTIRHRHNAH